MNELATSYFVSEYICGGALAGGELPPSLAAEGGAMLAAAVEDLAALSSSQVMTTLDPRLRETTTLPTDLADRIRRVSEVIEVSNPAEEIACFRRLAHECDATLVIAPEFDRILYERSRWVEESGGRLLGSSSHAVAIASDKYRTNRLLAEHGVPATAGVALRFPMSNVASDQKAVSPTCLPSRKRSLRASADSTFNSQPSTLNSFPAVLKPRFGAGSQCTYLIERASDAPGIFEQAVLDGIGKHVLLETYASGQPASVAILIGRFGAVPLPVASQNLSGDGRFHYLGGSLPLEGPHARMAQETALRAVECVPGLRGYVGVDLVLGDAGEPATVVEINPRLTTSYVALRQVVRKNLMGLIAGDQGGRPKLDVKGSRVDFTPDGAISFSQAAS